MGIIPETWSYSAAQSSTELLGSLSVSADDAESSTKASSPVFCILSSPHSLEIIGVLGSRRTNHLQRYLNRNDNPSLQIIP
ncbi:hypothetical protein NC652_023266 [Populus alba x Populus x berolinensis]|uniref:Uncharacterized protein n=1 Tax=Populus alba TaxID=43335 RepID=A0ACC4BPC9_POPAL|nr:hypothetical protein NC652_023266 [Populus alba x Populus x berolinensis]